ncbi:MAG: hypothetical protein O6945_09540 [Gammaproteobacteria bacterium]|nr:hypothetical protein [Gammaproteobacteria bacterium]
MFTQLSPQDASFLYLETPNQPMHVGSIAIYNPETSPLENSLRNDLSTLLSSQLKLFRLPIEIA